MKNLYFTLAIALVFFMSCSDDDQAEKDRDIIVVDSSLFYPQCITDLPTNLTQGGCHMIIFQYLNTTRDSILVCSFDPKVAIVDSLCRSYDLSEASGIEAHIEVAPSEGYSFDLCSDMLNEEEPYITEITNGNITISTSFDFSDFDETKQNELQAQGGYYLSAELTGFTYIQDGHEVTLPPIVFYQQYQWMGF